MVHGRFCIGVTALITLLLWTSAMADAAATAPATGPASRYVLHVPGIAGPRRIDVNLLEGLRQGGVDGTLESYDWTCGKPGVAALQAYERNREQAGQIAQLIARHFADTSTRSIEVTAHSAGAGLLVWALERLPEGVTVDSAVLIAPALSPTYDLSRALRHVRRNMVVFWSSKDNLVLSAGTKVFGTVDGHRGEAAGCVGFRTPASADAEQYKKLVLEPYRTEWYELYGNAGDHIGAMSVPFARQVLAPIVLNKAKPMQAATTAPATQAMAP